MMQTCSSFNSNTIPLITMSEIMRNEHWTWQYLNDLGQIYAANPTIRNSDVQLIFNPTHSVWFIYNYIFRIKNWNSFKPCLVTTDIGYSSYPRKKNDQGTGRGPEFLFVQYRSFLTADLSSEARMFCFFKRGQKGMIFIMQYHYIV